MVNKICDSPIHKAFATVLAFIILSLCFLPLAVSADSVYPNTTIGWKDGDSFRDIIAVVLDSWGISFSSNNDTLSDSMDSYLQAFYADMDSLQDEFWSSAQLGVNKLGQLILDHTTVGKVIQFANWLISKYNLEDNMTVDLSDPSSYYLNDIPLIPAKRIRFGNQFEYELVASYDTWFYLLWSGTAYTLCAFSLSSDNYVQMYYWGSVSSIYNLNQVDGSYYWRLITGFTAGYNPIPDVSSYRFNQIPNYTNPSAYYGAFNELSVIPARSIIISTDVINIPDPDPSEGLLVTVPEAEWGMSLFEILDLIERLIGLYDNTQLEIVSIVETLETLLANLQTDVSVNNIPGGVVLDYDEYDIPLENEWGLFDVFFNTGGDEITLFRPWQELRSILYGFPAPVLSFFALVVLFIVAYGFIRMGRDSH